MGLLTWFVLAWGFVTAVLTVIIHASHRNRGVGRHRQVLPSHYSSLLESDPSRYPGYCPACGSDNEPGYRLCENCGSEIPTVDDSSDRIDVRHMFND